MYTIAAFYQFAPLADYAAYRTPLLELAKAHGLSGSILLAAEGVNGTIAGTKSGIDAMLDEVRALPGCGGLEHKESLSQENPFLRMKVRLKTEIVTMGVDVDAQEGAGTYVEPGDWNALIADPDVALIDTRNAYEVEVGAFEGAINPKTESFGEFPGWLDQMVKTSGKKRVAMYCTGGIRCEKATAYARGLGFDEVYHLKGGILKYLEEVDPQDSKWNGECYVFDRRVTVGHGVSPGSYTACRACGNPVSREGTAHGDFEAGVSCANCIDRYSEDDRRRFRERQAQTERTGRTSRHSA
jgi:UPF0176 protein